ncbi:MAG: hypothetical protein P8P18_03410 [Schleiferiaceae bacterium]|jgi:hypothetical protein|nr:hypothetical protein [Schleiferiaceae bacterium]MDG1313242.1 hypothetical protein [Schleiferiaceae bacterium]MDG2110267.1 hypothetical protein [Schleiferiaceae bacterium]MDG2110268.1 hypothetical protein [Schleiferiaceae bacterium]
MKRKTLLFIGLLLSQSIFGQVTDFQKEFNSINENLMLSLGSYAVANFAISGVAYFSSEDEYSKRYHEMNVMWNTVNMGLALPGYIKARRGGQPMTRAEMLKAQKKTESIFLINDVLDLGYIATGIWMREVAPNQLDQEDLFKGYGNSLILQGSFLLAFDAVAYYIHHNHGKKLPAFEKVSLSSTQLGIGLRVALD